MNYAGLDVSGESIVTVLKDEEGNTVHSKSYRNNEEGLKKLVVLLQDCRATVEASTSGLRVYEYLNSSGISVVMANPSKIRLIYESDKKTDKNDAEVLANLLRTNLLPTCYVPPKDIQKQRNLVRMRRSLVEVNVRFKNQIRAELAMDGIKCEQTDVFGREAQEELSCLEATAYVKTDIQRLLRLGNSVLEEIKVLDEQIKEEYEHLPQAHLLDTIPGIAKNSAVTIMSEIGDIKRFDSPGKLCSYAGLVPRVDQSGSRRHDGHVKPGSRMLKTTLVQNATTAVLCCKRFRKIYLKLKRKKGHQKAIVAVARKMLTIIWFMLQRNKPFEGAVLCHRRRTAQ
jgi:transposase